MENIFLLWSVVAKVFSASLPFILLLGGLIFIHELGHFLVARYFKVRVEVFSLGFGPKILKYKKGDTIYCISLLPLGGYVKMFGDNPLKEVSEEEKSYGFLYKKAHQKWLIAFAGPFFNLVFTFLCFFLLALIGIQKLPARLGDLSENSEAFKKGFRSGDLILAVNGQDVSYYQDLDKILKKQKPENLLFDIINEQGEKKSVKIKSQKLFDPFTWGKERVSIKGLSLLSQALILGVPANSFLFEKGLRTFDKLLAISIDNSQEMQELKFWRELSSLPAGKKFQLKIQRKEKIKNFTFELETAQTLLDLGLESSTLYIEKVGANTPAERAGLKRGDRLLSLGGTELKEWRQVLKLVEKSEGQSMELRYQRGSEIKTLSLTPEKIFIEGNIKSQYMVGIISAASTVTATKLLKKYGPLEATVYSGEQTWKWLSFISLGLVRLITGEFSVRSMGGPITIGRVAHNSFSQGFTSFLFIMALISLNLFLLNLLPIPVLDGGHLLFFGIEALLGRPLSLKKLIIAQNIGLVFILSFMAFTIFNDIYNWLNAW